MSLKVLFGQRVKEIQENLFLSQEEFAEKIDVHRTTLTRIELGLSFHEEKTIEKIKELSGLSYREIFDFENETQITNTLFSNKIASLNQIDKTFILKVTEDYLKAKEKNSQL